MYGYASGIEDVRGGGKEGGRDARRLYVHAVAGGMCADGLGEVSLS